MKLNDWLKTKEGNLLLDKLRSDSLVTSAPRDEWIVYLALGELYEMLAGGEALDNICIRDMMTSAEAYKNAKAWARYTVADRGLILRDTDDAFAGDVLSAITGC